MILPCIEKKCLKFPICKTRMTVQCDVLYEHVSYITTMYLTINEHNKQIDILLEQMPNITFVETEITIDQKETAALLVGYMNKGGNRK